MNKIAKLKNKTPTIIPITHIAALLSEVKDTIYIQIKNKKEFKEAENFCSIFKFKMLFLQKNKNFNYEKTIDVLIGSNIKKMNEIKKLMLENKFSEVGFYLDYPECCVKKFTNWINQSSNDYYSIIRAIKLTNKIIPFYINNVTNFYSRLKSHLIRKMQKYYKLNKSLIDLGIDIEGFIIWHPCSYECKESLEKTKKIANFLKEYFPKKYMIKKLIHSKMIIFKDDFEFILINSEIKKMNKNNTIVEIKGFYPFPRTLINEIDLDKILKAKMIVHKNGKILYPHQLSNFILIPFGEDNV